MISVFFKLLFLTLLTPIVFCLQVINTIITIIQYIFVYKKYSTIQDLFNENSSYLNEILKV